MSKRGIFKFGLYDIPANCVLQHQDIFGNTTILSPGIKKVFGYIRKRPMDIVNRNFNDVVVRNGYNQDLIFDFSIAYKIAGGLRNNDEDSKLYQKSVDGYASEEKEAAAEDWLKIHQEEIARNSYFTQIAEQIDFSDKKNWAEHHPAREYLKYEDEIEDEIIAEENNTQSEPGILRNTIQNAVRDIFVNSDYYDLVDISSDDEKVKTLYLNLKRNFFKMGLQLEDLNLKNIRMVNNYIEYSTNSNINLNEDTFKEDEEELEGEFEYAELPYISTYTDYTDNPKADPEGIVDFDHISRKEFVVKNYRGNEIIDLEDIPVEEEDQKDVFDGVVKDIFGDKSEDQENKLDCEDDCPVIEENKILKNENRIARNKIKKIEEANDMLAEDNYDLAYINNKVYEQLNDTLSSNTRILVDNDIIENDNLALIKENEEYEKENCELSIENDKLNTKVLKLGSKLKDVSIKNTQLSNDLKDALSKNAELLVEKDKIENTNNELANKVEELETVNEETIKEKEELNSQLSDALSKNAELLVGKDKMENVNNELANRVEELETVNEETTKEKEELSAQLGDALSKNTELLVEKDKMENTNNELANRVEELETVNEITTKEKEELSAQLSDALSKNTELLVGKDEMENINNELANRVEELETENEATTKEKEELNTQLGEALSKNARILLEKEETENTNHELIEEIKKKETENELLRAGNSFVTAQLNQTYNIYKQKTSTEMDNIYLDNKNKELNKQVDDQSELIYDLSIANYDMEIDLQEKDNTIADLTRKNGELELELSDKTDLDSKIIATEIDNMYLERDKDELIEKTTTQDEVIYDIAIANYDLENELKEAHEVISSLAETNRNYVLESKENANKYAKLLVKKENIANKYAAAQNENKDLKDQISKLEQDNELLRQENANIVKSRKPIKLNGKTAAVIKTAVANKNKLASLTDENKALKEQLKETETRAINAEMDNIYLTSVNGELFNKATTYEEAVTDIAIDNYEINNELDEALTQNADLEEANENKSGIILALEDETADLKDKYKEEISKNKELITKQDEYISEIAKKDNEKVDLNNKIKSLETENAKVIAANDELVEEITKADEDIKELKDKLKNVDKSKVELQENIDSLKAKGNKLQNKLNESEKQNKELKTENAEYKEKEKILKNANSNLKNEKEKAEKENKEMKEKLEDISTANEDLVKNLYDTNDQLVLAEKEKVAAYEEIENLKAQIESQQQKEEEPKSTVKDLKIHKVNIDRVVLVKSNNFSKKYNIKINGDLGCEETAIIDDIVDYMIRKTVYDKVKDEKNINIKNLVIVTDDIPSKMTASGSGTSVPVSSKVKKI